MLPGLGASIGGFQQAGAAAPNPPSYIGKSQGGPTAGVYSHTFTINTGATDLVCVGHIRESNAGSTTTSVVCAGTTLTLWSAGAVQLFNFLNVCYLEFFFGVPGVQTTASVVSTVSAGATGVGQFVFVLPGMANSELDKATATTFSTDHVTLSDLQTAVSGAVIAIGACQTNGRSWTEAWSGTETFTEDEDVNSATGNSKLCVAHFASTAVGTTDDITLTMSSTSSLFGAGGGAISFGP